MSRFLGVIIKLQIIQTFKHLAAATEFGGIVEIRDLQ